MRMRVAAMVAALVIAAPVATVVASGTAGHDAEGGVAGLAKELTRATDWQLVERVPLAFDAHHPEGIAKVGDRFVLSTVEVIEPTQRYPAPQDGTDRTPGSGRGWLIEFDAQGNKLREVRVDDGHWIYHPGGLDFDGRRLWSAVAEYRPNRPSIIYSISPRTLRPRVEFRVPDHIGGIVHDTRRDRIVGLNWGSRTAYEWTDSGQEVDATSNPSHYVDYQDCKYLEEGSPRMLCGGIAELTHPGVEKYELGGIGVVRLPGMRPEAEVPFQRYTPQNHVATRNAIDVEALGERLRLYLVADDDDSELLVYEADLGGA
jgi:hypothetical protein